MLQAWAFAVAVAFMPDIYGAPFMSRWWVIGLGLGLVSFRFDGLPRTIYALMAIVISYAALGMIWTPALFGGALSLIFLAVTFAVMIAATSITPRERDQMLIAFSCGVAVSALLSVGQVYFDMKRIAQGSVPGGLFFNPEVLAEICAPVFVWCALKKFYPLAAILAVPLFLTHERAAWVVAALGLVYAVPRRFVRLSLYAAVVVAGAGVMFAFGSGKMVTADLRILYWGTALRSITLAGGGLGWWFQAHPFPWEEFVHSDLLQYFVELGAAGLALAAIPVLAFRQGRLALPSDVADVADRALLFCLCIEAVVSFPLHLPASSFLFAVAAGAVAFRHPDWSRAGLQSGTDFGRAHGRQISYGRGYESFNGANGFLVSARSAFSQFARRDRQGRTV